MITTDYSHKESTLHGAPISRYRLTHWLVDVLKNFFSDPINVKDERLQGLLRMHDGVNDEYLNALFRVEPPYNTSSIKACATPAIMVSVGDMQYPVSPVNAGTGSVAGAINALQMYERSMPRTFTANVAVLTESCDGTSLLAGIIEDFLLMNALNIQKEGMVHQFTVKGSTAPQRLEASQSGDAKNLYQIVIQLVIVGNITWTVDTQGPVYRGTSMRFNAV